MNYLFVMCCFLVLGDFAFGEEVKFSLCPGEENKCDIHSLRVNPCKEAATDSPCRIKRGKSASITFDYTPHFSGEKIGNRAYWTGGVMDIAFPGMNSDACSYTTCPLVSGTKTSYTYDLVVSKNYPTRVFDVKWKLWNEHDEQCCFILSIKLVK